MSDEEDANSLSTEPEDEFSPKIQMLKLRFEEEKRRLEVEASQRNKFAVQEWMREVREKEALQSSVLRLQCEYIVLYLIFKGIL